MAKTKLTNSEVLALEKVLAEVGEIKGNAKFSMSIARNRFALKPVVEALGSASEASKELRQLMADQQALFNKYGELEGDTIKVLPDNREIHRAELTKLNEKNKSVIATREKQLLSFEDELKKSVDLELFAISEKELPKGLSGNQRFGLMTLIQ